MFKETGYGLVRCSKKTGKVDMAMTGRTDAMLNLWGLQNTTKTKMTVVFDLQTGEIVSHYTGSDDGFPKVEKNKDGIVKYVNDELREALEIDFLNN